MLKFSLLLFALICVGVLAEEPPRTYTICTSGTVTTTFETEAPVEVVSNSIIIRTKDSVIVVANHDCYDDRHRLTKKKSRTPNDTNE